MKRIIGLTVLLALFAASSNTAWSQKADSKQTPKGDKLPIPDRSISMDLSAWKKVFTVEKITYNKDDNEVVFLLKAKKNFTFKDDGYDAPFEFLDAEGVSLTKDKNVTWEKEPKDLRAGDKTRATLNIPNDETLDKTKKSRAVVKGFFNK
jgi:hypothetical protein